ncbi:MAG: mono/diheme cytochrome c family protein, partial [Hyphomicrobiaceae bacterium]
MSHYPDRWFASVLHAALLWLAFMGVFTAASASANAQDASEPQVTEFLSRYCVRCHGPDRQKGDLRLDTLSRDFTDLHAAEQWR